MGLFLYNRINAFSTNFSKSGIYFGPAEYFALYLLAFCTLGGIGSENQAKSAIAVCLGLGISMIGVDNSTGMTRFTGGNLHLYDGVDFLVAIVGLLQLLKYLFLSKVEEKTPLLE